MVYDGYLTGARQIEPSKFNLLEHDGDDYFIIINNGWKVIMILKFVVVNAASPCISRNEVANKHHSNPGIN